MTGVLAVLFTIAGVFVLVRAENQDAVAGALIRTGILLGALWLALPTRKREAAWANVSPVAFVATLVAAVTFVARPRILVYLIPIGLALGVLSAFLRPRPK
ncbi:MAG: hypothetical protein DWQ34_07210 [Planctomycetota bacterium]|nr:MAG: hypothetical protein DWQ29_16745 [Planctomycetota bacterium]REJ94991.1 MAG: hypothetical protein DWQ34_07210 [Planctomycetota bacterium]REK23440.1 MAG: hypothetical protein DWQ41_16960 [Planctomycetota bacterium]REK38920.1 MAG: hypothetical protein DWQ45_03495 [Planctomycetota bacterium]